MQYTTDNVLVSLQRALADRLRANGYAVRWHETQQLEPHTSAESEPKATVTLTLAFPRDPAFVVRPDGLNDGSSPADGEIAVPAFSLQLPSAPKRLRRVGIGHKEFERQRGFTIEGFAWDDFQQRELLDLFSEWLEGDDVTIPINDYRVDPAAPTPLRPVEVVRADVQMEVWQSEIPAVRNYLTVGAIISYEE